uniref:Uncharacterized protein n=1 Tax=Toxoplasma gondii (strain ATCC 50861 / VEG) TaxID=432359 RepID=A0A0F7V6B5_TOXGV|nr:TPA: hypothetical protein BN1205_069445 [Toxoplasma gondii VEG]
MFDALADRRIARVSRRAVGLLLSSSWNLQPTGSASDGSVTGTEWPMCGIGGFWKPGGRGGALLVLAQRLATRVGRQRPHVEGDGIPIIEQFAPCGRRVLAMVDLAQCVGIRLRRQPPSAEGDGIPTTWMHVRASPVAASSVGGSGVWLRSRLGFWCFGGYSDSAGRCPGSLKRTFRMRQNRSKWRDKWRTRQQTDASEVGLAVDGFAREWGWVRPSCVWR